MGNCCSRTEPAGQTPRGNVSLNQSTAKPRPEPSANPMSTNPEAHAATPGASPSPEPKPAGPTGEKTDGNISSSPSPSSPNSEPSTNQLASPVDVANPLTPSTSPSPEHAHTIAEASYAHSVQAFYEQNWNGRVWSTGTYPCQSFPQVQLKADFGIALSGGGLRAATLGLGWLRGLARSGLLMKARYISANSGGSWVMEPLFLKAIADMDAIVRNKGLSPAALDSIYGEAIAKIADEAVRHHLSQNFGLNFVEGLAENILRIHKINAWSKAVDDLFTSIAGHTKSYVDIDQWPAEASRLPFWIINATLITVHDHVKDVRIAPFEFTPVFCGIPCDPRAHIDPSFGNNGGFVHRTVFATDYGADGHSPAVTQSQIENETDVIRTVQVYPNNFSLSEISAISSSAIMSGYLAETEIKLPFLTKFWNENVRIQQHYWACNQAGNQLEGGNAVLVDGAASDNTGIIALLRRKVANIMAFDASEVDIGLQNDQAYFENNFTAVLALFGLLTDKCTSILDREGFNRQRTVFPAWAWHQMIEALMVKRAAGEALVYNFPALEVLANPCCGVEAYTVNITFVFSGIAERCQRVEWNELQCCGRKLQVAFTPYGLLAAHPLGSDFPFIDTAVLHYSQQLVDRMADLAEWSITEGSPNLLADLIHHLDNSIAPSSGK